MPKVYKNRKKFIDPRYFLNETTHRDLLEFLPGERGGMPDITKLQDYKETICKEKDKFKQVISMLSPEMSAAAIMIAIPALKNVPQAQEIIKQMIMIYNGDENVKAAMDTAVDGFCLIPKIPNPFGI